MKALILSDNSYGCGASIAAFRIARNIHNSDVDVIYRFKKYKSSPPHDTNLDVGELRLFSPEGRSLFKRIVRTLEQKIRQRIINNDQRWITTFYLSLCIWKICKEEKIDIINLHNWNSGHYLLTQFNIQLPVVWTMHDELPGSGYNYTFKKIDGRTRRYGPGPNKWFAKFINKVRTSPAIQLVSPSAWLAELNEDRLKPFNSVRVINQTADDKFFPMDKEIARTVLNIPKDKKILLFLAGNGATDRKGHELFSDMVDDFEKLGYNIIVIGELKRSSHPAIVFQKNSVSEKLILNLIYNAADYFVIPSLTDNHPNTIIESLFTGTPVICSNRGGMPEMINLGVDGLQFDPYKDGDLISVLKTIDHQRFDKTQISEDAKKRYTETAMTDNYIDVFGKMTNEKIS